MELLMYHELERVWK